MLPLFVMRLVGVLIASAACVRTLPPAPTPPPIAPPEQTRAPVPEGHGRLVVDVVDGQTRVQRMVIGNEPIGPGRFRLFEVPELLCARTPCATDVPAGNLLLGFPVKGNGDLEVELVHVPAGEVGIYRRALSEYRDDSGGLRVFGIIETSIGGAALITGTVLLPVGLSNDNDTMTAAGAINLAAGAVMLAVGIWAIWRDSTTYRPGSSNHFPQK